MNTFLMSFSAGACFLLSFLLFFNPLNQNAKANQWLGLFVFIMGTAFIGICIDQNAPTWSIGHLIKWINSLQFLLAPSLYLSILFFVNPVKTFDRTDLFHFFPFLVYAIGENVCFPEVRSIVTQELFKIQDTIIVIRDLLPFQSLIYFGLSYARLLKHQANLRLISSSIADKNLDWLRNFLLILLLVFLFWINDTLFGVSVLLKLMPFVYTASIFFLAYFSIKQKMIFAFPKNDLEEIAKIFREKDANETVDSGQQIDTQPGKLSGKKIANTSGETPERLTEEQLVQLSARLNELINTEKIFLDNDLNLPQLAQKLEISIHDASFLINKITGGNFYTFINQHRVEAAKKLLVSEKMRELNILGIAFASGFNSKTTFNTAFKKWTGIAPTDYANKHKNQ